MRIAARRSFHGGVAALTLAGVLILGTGAVLAQSPAATAGPDEPATSAAPCLPGTPDASMVAASMVPDASGMADRSMVPCETVTVSATEFSLTPSTTDLAAGEVTFVVKGDGVIPHEFVVVRTDLPADQLPLDEDRTEVDEDAVDAVGEVEDVDPGTTQDLVLTLAPGNYVAFCNIENHYGAGMHVAFTVH